MKTIYTTLFLLKSYILSIGLLLLTIQMRASPDCPILNGDFHGLSSGTTSDSNATGWYLDASDLNNPLFFAVKSNRIHAEHLGGEGIWYSEVFSAEGYSDFQVSVKIHSEGDMNSSEYARMYYKIDGGPEVLFAQRTGNFGTIDFISPFLNGSTVQIIVKLYNYNNGGSQTSKYHIEKYAVFKEDGPCNSSISVSATATNGGILTCTNPSLTLSANSNVSNPTYSWTGPNNFSSSLQNPVISIPGTYTVKVTDSSGSTSASILITENKGISEIIWLEEFNLSTGTTSDSGSTAWTTQNTSSGGFHVKDNRFKVNNTGKDNKGIWTSESIDISDKTNVKISLNLYSTGDMETNGDGLDFIDIYYKLDDGQKIRFSKNSGSINGNSTSGKEVSIGSLNGSSLQIIVKSRTTHSSEFYYFDNVKVVGLSTVDATAFVDGELSCINNSVIITGGSSDNHVNYTWTGPNGFTANTKNINVSEPGDYTLEVTPNNGCGNTANAMVTVTQDITVPNVSASVDGTLSCSSGSATLRGNSTTPNVTYLWTGPNNFSSSLQNPTVSQTGNYSLTVTNPNNGCTSSLSVNVASTGGTETNIWFEKFNLSTGTTSDSGSTAWTTQNTSSGGFHVKDNRFKVNNTGKDKKGIWTSESIDIKGKNDVNISVLLYSTGDMEDTGENLDFIDLYYKINEGQEVRFSKNSGAINNNSSSGTTVSIGSLSGNSLQIIVKSRTTASDEFYYFDNVKVTEKNPGTIDATASVEGILTCINDAVTITGGSSDNDVNYNWTGPNNFTANTKNINVSEPGDYTLEVTNDNGCTGSKTVTVTQDIIVPNVSASVDGTLSCSSGSATLRGNSTTPNVTYLWTGPNNFSSSLQNPTVSQTGNYSLTVTNPNNGCTSSLSVNVASTGGTETNIWFEKFNLSTGTTSDSGSTAWTTKNPSSGGFHVKDNRFKVNNTGKDKKGIWTSESIDIKGKNDVNISVLLYSTGDMEDTGEGLDFIDLYYKINEEQEVRFSKNSGTINNNSSSGTTVSIGSLSGNSLQIIVKSRTTASDEFYYFDNVKVTEKNPGTIDATASVEGILTCINDVVTITGGSSDNSVHYNWTGPNNFTANTKNINVSEPGDYTLEVTNNNGCTGSKTVTVTQDIIVPNVSASVDGTLSCSSNAVILKGNSTTPNVTYLWTGPNNFSSSLQNPTVSQTGNYSLTVTNPNNGCTSSLSVNVASTGGTETNIWFEKFNLSTGTTSDSGSTAWTTQNPSSGGFHVKDNRFKVNNTGKDKKGIWTSESIDIKGKNDVNISVLLYSTGDMEDTGENLDFIDLYYKINEEQEVRFSKNLGSINNNSSSGTTVSIGSLSGNSLQIIVKSRTTASDEFYYFDNVKVTEKNPGTIDATASVEGILTCINDVVTITGGSSDNSVNYNWTGPNGFTANTKNINVSEPGDYTLEVTNDNGCTGSKTVTVSADLDQPELTATADGIITCSNTAVALTATSTTPNVTFNWEGFTDGENPVNVTSEGDYVVTATNTINGCSIQQTVTVSADLTKPELTTTADGIITCSNTSVALTATSTTPNVTFNWEGFTDGENPVNVTSEGDYIVTATNTINGCSIQQTVTVSADLDQPELTATADGIITCSNTAVALTATSTTPNVTFNWEGFTAGENPVNVTSEGDYVVTATNTINGCSIQQTVTVSADLDQPELSASADGIITCSNTSVALTATSTTPNVTFNWEGFTDGENPVNVTSEGDYVVTATNTINGCSIQQTVTVSADLDQPELSANADGIITCSNTSVALTATSTTPNVTFNWEGFTDGENPVNVTSEGEYRVTATNTITGCTKQETIIVSADLTKPELTATADGIITCTNTSVALTATSTTSNVTFNWEGFTDGENPVNVTSEGEYRVTATNTITGCTKQETIIVSADLTKPELTVTADGMITCSNTSVTLTATSTNPNVIFSWTGFTAGENPVNVTSEGEYMVTATNTITGCTRQETIIVSADLTKPELTATADGIITCTNTSVALTATSTTPNVTFNWEGFTAGENPVNVTSEGEYRVTATNTITGCTKQETIIVTALCDEKNDGLQSVSNIETRTFTKFIAKAYPNPSRDKATIAFSSAKEGNAKIEIYTITGILVNTLFDEKIEADRQYYTTFNQDGDLPSGVYFYVVRVGNNFTTDRIILAK
ncbi:T9SS type A sorting domain-containing protein [Aquimarina algiphila]|uniref:T9SS type A sorting domain-containing protein n=1 Tax=Aquimarina algiphila TaxID=2047982 RepID=UPI00248FBF6E|nr:T9SS type A sorting domain-containing protein [Aquimarina algiphila]